MLDHERLDVYHVAIEFLALAHRIIESLPRGNASLTDQLRRASLSVPLNIAEGTGKRGARDRARFYGYSRGPAMECGALLDALQVTGLCDSDTHAEGKRLLVRTVSMLSKMC
ncbi:MAG: four helix bundle protein [Deltaproteobacteria bacterium]|nr:four helix bundle protein [Deltaproteobacteria bacterium]